MHIFTSITSNYLPKARVLAQSVKKHVPDAVFHVLLCDRPPAGFDLANEDFDYVILLDELEIENRQAWIFQHNVVELCTAVKALGFQEIMRRHGAEKIVFLDPDIVVFSGLDLISRELDVHSVLLTPHQTEPESSRSAIIDHEVASLKFGVFNLGFLAVRSSDEGKRFIRWWGDRLRDFCFDDRRRGLFTDQKWMDLAPALFPDLGILRESHFNVSTWNINQRRLDGDLATGVHVDGEPLCFYHFSGFDSGAMKVMSEVYGSSSPVIAELRAWYLKECAKRGQGELGDLPCHYALYSDGEVVTPAERLLYRVRDEPQERFPDPYNCSGDGGYRAWYRAHGPVGEDMSDEQEMVAVLHHELDTIRSSISFRVFKSIVNIYRRAGIRLGLARIFGGLNR